MGVFTYGSVQAVLGDWYPLLYMLYFHEMYPLPIQGHRRQGIFSVILSPLTTSLDLEPW